MTGYMNPDGSELVGAQLPSGAGQALQLDSAGNLKVNVEVGGGGGGSNASVGTNATAAPASSTQIGAQDGSANLQPLQLDGSKNLKTVDANSAAIKSDLDTLNSTVATAANQSTANTSLSSITTNTSNTATVLGGTNDAAVLGDTPGSLSAKARGLSKILNAVWDSVNNLLRVAGNVASGSPDAGNPVKVGGVYNSTAPSLSSGQRGDLQLDSSGNVRQTLATLIAGEDLSTNRTVVEERYSYYNVTATGTTIVKSGAGFIHSLTFNNPSQLTGATTASTLKLYDNTSASGTLIGTISLPASSNLASALPFTLLLDDSFLTGLTLVITLGTSGAWTPDITVSYR